MIEFIVASEIFNTTSFDDACNVCIKHTEYANSGVIVPLCKVDYLCHCETPELAQKMANNLTLAYKRIMAIEWAKQFIEVPVNELD